jgi:hypothetical protein
MEHRMRFFQSQEYYKSVKVSAKEAKGMLVSIDMQLEQLLMDANKTFDEYIESVDMVKNLAGQTASITTDIEHDQTDEKHFIRAGGELHRSARTSMENLKDYVEIADKRCDKYFDICDRIRNLMYLRTTIVSKCNPEQVIEKQEASV